MKVANNNFNYEKIKLLAFVAAEKTKQDYIHNNTVNHLNESLGDIEKCQENNVEVFNKVADLFEYLYTCMDLPRYSEYHELVHFRLSKIYNSSV